MNKKNYKQLPELKTEQEYADFWNSVSDATDYLDPKRFKAVKANDVLPQTPSVQYQVTQVKKLAKRYRMDANIVLYRILKAGIRELPEFKSLL